PSPIAAHTRPASPPKMKGAMGNVGSAMFTPWRLKDKESADETKVPYGVAIALGTFWAWFVTEGML
ncbi:hypothetical protein ACFL01_02415, partial [Planctomycetota bacterium]